MIASYNVERFDSVTFAQLKKIGFTSELLQFLSAYGISKDQVTEFCERAADDNLKLDVVVAGILNDRAEAQAAE